MKNKTIVIMGGGTAGWVSALYFLNKNKNLNLNLKIKLISSDIINPIGVGEGTTPTFTNFIENICKIDRKEFLKETKGSFKHAIKFSNWNFDGEYYYHTFSSTTGIEENDEKYLKYDFIQYAINEDLNIPQKELQKKIHGLTFDLLENNKISLKLNNGYAYHFSANLIIPFFKKKCLEFKNFEHIEGTINHVSYDKNGFIQSINIKEKKINGNFFINCLGFSSIKLLNEEYFDIKYWNKYILNDSAFAIQVKNSPLEIIEPYTTISAQEYGWSWKVPQYDKTGYGYVYSSDFINDEDKLYNDILKTYNIKENDVFKTRVVKSYPHCNDRQLHKNCLSLGLASGFVEPLEATSIHMTLVGLNTFFELIESDIDNNIKLNNIHIFNKRLEKYWENVFKFIIFHYYSKNPINDYWKYYRNIHDNKIFDFYEKYIPSNNNVFEKDNYLMVSFGKRIKDFYYSFMEEKYLKNNIQDYLSIKTIINCQSLESHNDFLMGINKS